MSTSVDSPCAITVAPSAARRTWVILGRCPGPARSRLLEDVRAGHSAVLSSGGEAGIGKTTLLHDSARRASGFRVAQIAGVESEMELAYAGLHQLCTSMLDRLDVLPEPQQVALRVALGLASGDPPDMKLGINSRKDLRGALPARIHAVAPA